MKVYCKIRNCIIGNFLWSCDHRKGFIAQQIFIFLFENEESRLKILASEKSYSWTCIAIIKHYLLIAERQTYHFNKSSTKRLHSFSSPFLPNISWSCWPPLPPPPLQKQRLIFAWFSVVNLYRTYHRHLWTYPYLLKQFILSWERWYTNEVL